MAAEDGDLAVSALVAGSTLLGIALQAPRAEQVETFARLTSLNKAVKRAGANLWRELCLARWPSSRAVADVDQPRAWRLFALSRSFAELPPTAVQRASGACWRGAAPWQNDELLPLVADGHTLFLLDVFDRDSAIFAARLVGTHDALLFFNGIVADEDDAAEEFSDAHQQLHLAGANKDIIQAFPRLLLLHAQAQNALDACLVRAVEEWNADAGDEAASSDHKHAPTAQLCVVQADGKVAVLELSNATSDRYAHSRFRDDCMCVLDERWQESPSGMLRWARTFRNRFSSRFGEAGFDCILNIYCVSEAELDGLDGLPVELDAEAASPSDSSDVSAGEVAVREVAADRLQRMRRLRHVLRAHDAERAVLSRALQAHDAEREVLSRPLADLLEGRAGGSGSDGGNGVFPGGVDLEASPRLSNSSQLTESTFCDSSSASDGATSEPTARMRLALASLSLGWIPAGDVRQDVLRRKREEFAVEHNLPVADAEDELELSEGEEDAVKAAEAGYFWTELDEQMPWIRR